MLDVSRNFMEKSTVLKIIKMMARYKLNKLHLHLTDDEGWRLEMPSLPELTQVGGIPGWRWEILFYRSTPSKRRPRTWAKFGPKSDCNPMLVSVVYGKDQGKHCLLAFCCQSQNKFCHRVFFPRTSQVLCSISSCLTYNKERKMFVIPGWCLVSNLILVRQLNCTHCLFQG